MIRSLAATARSRLFAPVVAAALVTAVGSAQAQARAPGTTSSSASLSAITQLDADLDGGGSAGWSGFDLGLGTSHQFSPQLSAGVGVRYQYEHWSFDTPGVFGAAAPWGDIQRPGVSFSVGYALAPDLALFVAPQVQWSFETGASASQALSYGAVFGVTKFFSPTLALGLGLGAFRQIDSNQFFPFLIVNWKISDTLRLTNPLQAGPAGGAGLELAYALGGGWESSLGAAYRSYRFRLDDQGVAPDGVGQNAGVPVFARLTRRFGPTTHIDLYAGAVLGGRLKLISAGGATLQSADYGAAPLLAISGTIGF